MDTAELNAQIAEYVFGATGRMVVYEWADRKQRAFPMIAFGASAGGPYDENVSRAYRTFVTEAGEKLDYGAVTMARNYAGDLAEAWRVVEAMRELDGVWDRFADRLAEGPTPLGWLNAQETAAFICRAALAVMTPEPR